MTDIDWEKPNISIDEVLELFNSNGSHSQKQEALEHAYFLTKTNDEEGAVKIILKALENDDQVILQIALNFIAISLGHRTDLLESVKEFLGHESENIRIQAVNAVKSIRSVNN